MKYFDSHLRSAVQILEQYNGIEPFASFLKKYFAANKKFGSKDRREISELCYSYFRLGKAGNKLSHEEGILAGKNLCSRWSENIREINDVDAADKISITNVFPWKDELSDTINHEEFCNSFFIRPDVFLRLREGHEHWVKQKLEKAGISFIEINHSCLALPPSSKIDTVLALDYEAMVQDLNSQRTGEFMKEAVLNSSLPFISAWDCCSGSGGKSLMLYDIHAQLDLTVSDVRESILINLKKRFATHEIKNYTPVVADLSARSAKFKGSSKFDFIMADVPCTGSGTWSRTPEQLFYFDERKITEYAELQKKIVSNAIPHLNPGGYFLYITCSVFKKENEENVAFIKEKFHLELVRNELLKGYDKKADSMFAALFKKPL